MVKYILRRLLIMLPTLFVIMLISFMISRNVPGDPVQLEMEFDYKPGTLVSRESNERIYREISHSMGLDLPPFYFSLQQLPYPDTLHRVLKLAERASLEKMIGQYGNWEAIQDFYQKTCIADIKADDLEPPQEEKLQIDEGRQAIAELRYVWKENELSYRFDLIDSIRIENAYFNQHLGAEIDEMKASYSYLKAHTQLWKLYIPKINFYGIQNQFHHWSKRVLMLDFGKSQMDRRPVIDKIKDAMPWSLFMGFFSFVVSFLIAIPIGVWSVRKRNQWQDRFITILLFLMHSVPSFLAAMILMTFFCNPEYWYLFPTSGVSSDNIESMSFWNKLLDYSWHLTLPTITFTYGAIAVASRQMRVGMLETINMDFIRTARAKGLSESTVIWKHALRNSVLPLLTLLGSFLPHLIGGAVIIESVFSVPGMGRLMIQAIYQYDHAVILAVFTLAAIATLVGILLTDVLYAIVDPRISFSKKG